MDIESILRGKRIAGIEIYSHNGEDWCAIQTATKQGNKLKIESQYIGDSHNIIKFDQPAFLILNTQHILHKQISGINIPDEKLLQQAFPGTDINQFYYEIFTTDLVSLIAIARKDYIQDQINQWTKNGYKIVGFGLGLSSLGLVKPFLNCSLITTNTHSLSWSSYDDVIRTIEIDRPISYSFDTMVISSEYIMSFAGLLRILKSHGSKSNNNDEKNEELANEFYQKAFFKKALVTATLSMFIILIINFFLFLFYTDSLQKINGSNEFHLSANDLNDLREIVVRNDRKIEALSNSNEFPISQIINDIAKSVPSSAILTDLEFNPLISSSEKEGFKMDNNTILVSGNFYQGANLAEWIGKLEKVPAITKVIVTDLNSAGQQESDFSLKIELR